jgi:hypothetical protein
MRRLVACLLLLMTCVAAQASGRHENWGSLKKLMSGTLVLVQAGVQLAPEFCDVVQVDDAFLTCDRVKDPDANWTSASGARLMFPRSGVKNVWVWETDDRLSVGMWIAIGLSAALEISISVAAGAVGAYVGALTLAAAWTAAETDPWRIYMPPKPPKMRRRLVYRAPQVPAGSVATP